MNTTEELKKTSLRDIEWMVREPGKHHIHRYGFQAVSLELIRRLKKLETPGRVE